ncbi:MAG: cysteine desulfurase [Pseudonocardiales bacterium]|nr:cysteine desulfurase [Pseudonocardiales bacterium]
MPQSNTGYLDAAAGLPSSAIARAAEQAATEDGWADPAKVTGPGRRSAVLLDAARETMARELGVQPDEVTFVPSGSHALQLAVLGTVAGRHRAGTRLVLSAVEHSAVFKAADWHASRPGALPEAELVEVVGVDGLGRVDLDGFVTAASRPGVAAAVLQAANHEVGTRQPVAQAAAFLRERGVPLVVDATHEVLYGPAPAEAAVFAVDARMWGGPAGVGVLVVRRGTRWLPPFPVDESEAARSLGVVNVPAAVAAAASLRAFHVDRDRHAARLSAFIEQIRGTVARDIADAVVLGDPVDRLPHLLTFSSLYLDGEALLTALDREGFVVSSGSSCTSDTLTPSHVLVAMGALTSGNIRISLHPDVTDAEIERFLEVLPRVVDRVRADLPAGGRTSLKGEAGQSPATAERLIDARGRRCPLPILDLARAWPDVELGQVVTVLADDPAAESDIPAWSRMRDQEYLGSQPREDGAVAYRVRRLS